MSKLIPVAEQLLMLGALGGQMKPRQSDRAQQIIFGFAGVLTLVAVVYLIVALSYWLKMQYTPDIAALATAGITLSFAILVAAAGYTITVIRKTKVAAVTDELRDKVLQVISAVSEEMEDPIRDHPKSSVALATLAGYVVGNRLL